LPSSGFWWRSRRQAMTFASVRATASAIAESSGKGVSGAFMEGYYRLETRRAALISHGNETIRRQEHHVGAGLRAHRAGRAHASPILPLGRLAAPRSDVGASR